MKKTWIHPLRPSGAAARLFGACALALLALGGPHAFAQQGAARQAVPEPARELLNSERIEQEFGSYGIEVLDSDARLRVSTLYSETGGARIGRTFAVVFYPEEVDPLFAAEHAEIQGGGSIGAVFARAGWTVTKSHRYFGEVASSPKVAGLMHVDEGRMLALHVYVLEVAKAGRSFEYAAIAEVHHPEYLQLGELGPIYGQPAARRPGDDALVSRILAATARAMR